MSDKELDDYEKYIWVNPWDQKLLEKIREEKETEEREKQDEKTK